MRSVVAISLLACITNAEKEAADPVVDLMKMIPESDINSKEFADKLGNKLVTKLYDRIGTMPVFNDNTNTQDFTDKFADRLVTKVFDRVLTTSGLDADHYANDERQLAGAADQGTAEEWIKYNSEVDPKMALAAEAWAALARSQRANAVADDNDASSQQELAETSTNNISLLSVALTTFFVGSVLTLAVQRFRSSDSTEDKDAVMAGYSPFNA